MLLIYSYSARSTKETYLNEVIVPEILNNIKII